MRLVIHLDALGLLKNTNDELRIEKLKRMAKIISPYKDTSFCLISLVLLTQKKVIFCLRV